MQKSILALCESLDTAASVVLAVQTDNRRIPDLSGVWHAAMLNREQLADIPADLAARLRQDSVEEITGILAKKIDALSESIKALSANIIPNLFNANAANSVNPYLTTFQYVAFVLDSNFGWRTLPAKSSLPATLVRRIDSLQNQLKAAEANTDQVQNQLKLINSAYEAAENLPATTLELSELIEKVNANASISEGMLDAAKVKLDKADNEAQYILGLKESADKIIAKCEAAYRIATTTGLAGAFDLRARSLSISMWVWVAGLFVALGLGGYFGYLRVEKLSELLKNVATVNGTELVGQFVLSLISIGAPVWFAWLSTKQIGQRFRLSEDYAFKATLAKAYEGYRSEAARIDKDLERRLFSSALDRLEEAPLRLVEVESHGSPFHELRVGANKLKLKIGKPPKLNPPTPNQETTD